MMAATNTQVSSESPRHHKNKSVLRSFMRHRRNDSDGDPPSAAPLPTATRGPVPLEETSHNRHQEPSAGPYLQSGKHVSLNHDRLPRGPVPASPTRKTKLTIETTRAGPTHNENKSIPTTPSPRKSNFASLLSRPKSLRGLQKQTVQLDHPDRHMGGSSNRKSKARAAKDKENCTPPGSVTNTASADPPPPIYAQFCTNDADGTTNSDAGPPLSPHKLALAGRARNRRPSLEEPPARGRHHTGGTRPKSFHPGSSNGTSSASLLAAAEANGPVIDPKDIDTHLEALLDRRNIPEHQRYKMRSLAAAIKMEFIRQDWAESRAKRSKSHDSTRSSDSPTAAQAAAPAAATSVPTPATPTTTTGKTGKPDKSTKSKHSRVKSLTLSRVTRGRSRDRGDGDNATGNTSHHKSPGLSLRKKAEDTLGRHLRSKSTENMANVAGVEHVNPSAVAASMSRVGGGGGNAIVGLFNKAKGPQQHTPGDFVQYLRTVQKPELVEVGKLHKLRLLLRNETVAWTEAFIGQGGMEETVGLLHRILAIEWREEHEDALLHETLLCLKALCTTALALQYLHANQASLLPALIHMIFDPEKKGPSEFTTRSIVTWLLFTYIQSASLPEERAARARTILGYLRDPEGSEDSRTVSFVLEMRRDRPYRVWCKEVVNVTKEVFWIFLHHLNVISLPIAARVPTDGGDSKGDSGNEATGRPPPPPSHMTTPSSSYMLRHFPKERPPVPAAPYVGGVEWEATNYLASHLDLVNAILACMPTAAERKRLREQMQMSGWERCMGGSLRLCKEKFYGAVHDGLRTWVAAAHEDGWDVRDVRYGPPPPAPVAAADRHNDVKKIPAAVSGPMEEDPPAPKIEIPKLDFVLDSEDL